MTTDAREPLTDLYGRHRKFWDNEWCWCCMEHTPCSDSLIEELALALAEVRRLRAVLRNLVSMAQPLDLNTDRGYWACYWCDGDGDALFSYGSRPPFPHAPGCPLVEAVRVAGVPLDR